MTESSERDPEKDTWRAPEKDVETPEPHTPDERAAEGEPGGNKDANAEPGQLARSNSDHRTDVLSDAEFSVFTKRQKRFIVFMASWAGFFSPVSSQIYYPALTSLSRDLSVSTSLINLTLTSCMVSEVLSCVLYAPDSG